ncbi:hypothetical protein Taro_009951 [Colocasia esculenta]|uniref:Uncharacterized protein n=1 Tax=Colocasia esculenta TaxID=4460 RepID=A0A843TXP8_COLES|nr:hypothetical protein [Colocasia esculenta]
MGNQVATATLIATAKCAAIRSRPTRATPLLMSRSTGPSRRKEHFLLAPRTLHDAGTSRTALLLA